MASIKIEARLCQLHLGRHSFLVQAVVVWRDSSACLQKTFRIANAGKSREEMRWEEKRREEMRREEKRREEKR